jgi:hypothetical protein
MADFGFGNCSVNVRNNIKTSKNANNTIIYFSEQDVEAGRARDDQSVGYFGGIFRQEDAV